MTTMGSQKGRNSFQNAIRVPASISEGDDCRSCILFNLRRTSDL